MDPLIRAREYLLDNIGHMTRPGIPSVDKATGRWLVPIQCRTDQGEIVVGDIELDDQGHILYAPSRDSLVARLRAPNSTGDRVQTVLKD
jgi:hypothetical protein